MISDGPAMIAVTYVIGYYIGKKWFKTFTNPEEKFSFKALGLWTLILLVSIGAYILIQTYNFGENGEKQLSLLQQGIQGITEDTAGALEAYMNGVSQQVYLHSDLLTQIRDAVVGFDLTLNASVQAQMLLQLQNQYIIMQSIESMMSGWSTPSGQGIRVEMIS